MCRKYCYWCLVHCKDSERDKGSSIVHWSYDFGPYIHDKVFQTVKNLKCLLFTSVLFILRNLVFCFMWMYIAQHIYVYEHLVLHRFMHCDMSVVDFNPYWFIFRLYEFLQVVKEVYELHVSSSVLLMHFSMVWVCHEVEGYLFNV